MAVWYALIPLSLVNFLGAFSLSNGSGFVFYFEDLLSFFFLGLHEKLLSDHPCRNQVQ